MTGALLNHLWQSSAILLIATLLAGCLRRHPARLRFWIWQMASLKFLVPFAALALLAGTPKMSPARPASAAAVRIAQPFAVVQPDAQLSPLAAPLPRHADLTPWLVLLWLTGCLAVLAVWLHRWRQVHAARRAGRSVAGPMPTALIEAEIEPGVFGIFRPVLLLPADLHAHLSPQQFEAVVAHELCHARRHDNLWSALHQIVTALFWFFPPVYWLGARLVAERERACDEAVLADGADAQAYAAGVLQVCRHYAGIPATCAAGVSGGDLARRVRGILSYAGLRRLSRPAQLGLAALAVAAIATPFAARQLFAQQAAVPRVTFDAASIREWGPGEGPGGKFGVGVEVSKGRVHVDCNSLAGLITFAFHLMGSEPIEGMPDWAHASCGYPDSRGAYTLEATMPADSTDAQTREMMQTFLAERFDLAAHWDTRQMPIYELVIAPGGFKLGPSDPDKDPPIPPHSVGCPTDDPHCHIGVCCGSMPLSSITWSLTRALGRPVIDKTGLHGTYFFDRLEWAGDDSVGSSLPSLPALLRDKFGLEYKPAVGPVPVLVIDHVEKLRAEP